MSYQHYSPTESKAQHCTSYSEEKELYLSQNQNNMWSWSKNVVFDCSYVRRSRRAGCVNITMESQELLGKEKKVA